MEEALRALLPESLDPYAPMIVGAFTALLILAIYEELNTRGIEIPFDQIVVHLAS